MKRYLFILLFVLTQNILFSQEQDIKKEVYVVTPYRPSVSVARKIDDIPSVSDSIRTKLPGQYFVMPFELPAVFVPRPVKPAKMLGLPVQKLYANFVRVGMGNYAKPMAEFYTGNTRNKDFMWGMHGLHESSFGKLKLENNKKVSAGYHDSYFDLYTKRIFDKVEWSGDIDLSNNAYYFYGYNTADTLLKDYNPNKKDIRQNRLFFRANTFVQSTQIADSSNLNYSAGADYVLFNDHYDNQEQVFNFSGNLNKYFGKNKVGIDGGFKGFTHDNDSMNRVMVNARPYLSRFSDIWSAYAGLDFYTNKTIRYSLTHYYPVGYLACNIMKHYVVPYVGVTGSLEINDYTRLMEENPFINPVRLNLQLHKHEDFTEHQLTIYGGVKGNFTPRMSFNFRYWYDVVSDMYFFVNDYTVPAGNVFNIVFDDVEYRNYTGEINYLHSQKLSFYLRGRLFKYSLATLDKPWHKPEWDANFSCRYNIRDKIIVNAEILGYGKRPALNKEKETIYLHEFVDVNLSFNYFYSKVLSGFLRFNNLGATRYSQWYQYPVQGFNMMLGITYSL